MMIGMMMTTKFVPAHKVVGDDHKPGQIVLDDDWYISRRIACPDAGYPLSEARYATIDEYLADRYQEDARNV